MPDVKGESETSLSLVLRAAIPYPSYLNRLQALNPPGCAGYFIATDVAISDVLNPPECVGYFIATDVAASDVLTPPGCAGYLSSRSGPSMFLMTCSVVEPRTISTIFEWCDTPMNIRSWPFSL